MNRVLASVEPGSDAPADGEKIVGRRRARARHHAKKKGNKASSQREAKKGKGVNRILDYGKPLRVVFFHKGERRGEFLVSS